MLVFGSGDGAICWKDDELLSRIFMTIENTRPFVIVESPYAGEVAKNTAYL